MKSHVGATLVVAPALGQAQGLPLPLVVLNGCEAAAEARSVAQALVERGLARAAVGHPRLVELIVAQAGRRDLAVLLREVQERRGDFRRQLERVYEWSARLLEERGQLEAWQALLLFPGGVAPEVLLWAAAGEKGASALREAALAGFDPGRQAWRWHPTVAEYARSRWPPDEAARRRLTALLPAWEEWLRGLPEESPETARRLEDQQANLDLLLREAIHLPAEPRRGLLRALGGALPAPDKTLALRPFEERVYRTWARLATEEAERAEALHMLGWALSALGRRGEALAATAEAVAHYRQLAAAHPQAFLPYLAGSLHNLGSDLSALGRREEALAATEEAVRTLAPFFLALPAAFADRIRYMVRDYVDACRALGQEPDEALLGPIRKRLEEGGGC
jgi:tetratricopeptide (TPR) repeat protein